MFSHELAVGSGALCAGAAAAASGSGVTSGGLLNDPESFEMNRIRCPARPLMDTLPVGVGRSLALMLMLGEAAMEGRECILSSGSSLPSSSCIVSTSGA
jgi:hypothetical protein